MALFRNTPQTTTKAPEAATVLLAAQDDSASLTLVSNSLSSKELQLILDSLQQLSFTGEAYTAVTLPAPLLKAKIPFVIVSVGVELTPESARHAAAVAANATQATTLTFDVEAAEDILAALVMGVHLAPTETDYHFSQASHVAKGTKVKARNVEFKVKNTSQSLDKARIIAEATVRTRQMVNEAGNAMTPQAFSAIAKDLAKSAGFAVSALDGKALGKSKYASIDFIGGGSSNAPVVLELHYKGKKPVRHLGLVGQGITFDAGGAQLYPAREMTSHKKAMAGAATVLNAISALALSKAAVEVTAVLPLYDNVPSENSPRPSDVVEFGNGKTAELTSLRGEAQHGLIDAMLSVAAVKPDAIISLAAMSPTQVVGFGYRTAAVLGAEDTVKAVCDASEVAGEQLWPLPMPESSFAALKSQVADAANSNASIAPLITHTAFIHKMLGDDIAKNWAHLDMTGPAYNDIDPEGYLPKAATGFGVRTLVEFATRQ